MDKQNVPHWKFLYKSLLSACSPTRLELFLADEAYQIVFNQLSNCPDRSNRILVN